jgi:hypothetical protein
MHQQSAFPYDAQRPLPIDHQPVMPSQPPDHATITVGRLFAASQDDFLIARAIRTAAAWLPAIVETRPADLERLGHQLRFVPLGYQLPCRRMGLPAAHSPSTFFKISICKCDQPNARSRCLVRFFCSKSSHKAAILPQAQPWLLTPTSSFQRS